MVEQDQTPSKVTQAHLQSLVSQRLMMVVELATCRVPEDLTSPAPMEGHVAVSWHFMSGDSVCRCTDSFAHCCSTTS
jgi:hypothetical protein